MNLRLDSKRRWALAAATISIALAGWSLWVFGERSSTLAWLLHLTSLGLFLLSAYLWNRAPERSEDKRAWSRLELAALAVVLIVAAFMRLYRLNEFPFGTYYDEADNGLSARRIVQEHDYRPVYVASTNLPAHYLYLIAGAFQLFGVSTYSARLASVALGLATVAAGYLVGRELFDRRWGLVAAFLLAVSRWDMNWSRMAMHGVSTPLFTLLVIGLLLRALRRNRLSDFAWAGLSVGLSLCFYVPLRVFPLVVAVFLAYRAIVERGFLHRVWPGLIVLSVAALLAVAPVVQFAVREPETFWERTRWASVATDQPNEPLGQVILQSALKHVLMFNVRGDPNPRHNLPGEPMLDPFNGVLMVLGLGVCLWRWREPRSFLLLAWLGVMLMGGIFSRSEEAPHSLRAIGSLPAAYLLVVMALDGLAQWWRRQFNTRYAWYGALALLALLVAIGAANYYSYFERQVQDPIVWSAYSTGETITAQLMVELGDSVEYYIPWDYVTSLTIPFIAGERKFQLLDSADELPLQRPATKDVVLLMDASRRGLYRDAKVYYPQATLRKWDVPSGEQTVLFMVRLTPADVASAMNK